MKLLLVLFSFFSLFCSCYADTPKSTVEEMRDKACGADIPAFFNYVNKTEVENNVRKQIIGQQEKEIKKETDLSSKAAKQLEKSLSEALIPSMVNMLWNGYEDEIKKGKEGGLCKMTVLEAQEEEVKVQFPSGKIQTLKFTKYDDRWLLTEIIVQ